MLATGAVLALLLLGAAGGLLITLPGELAASPNAGPVDVGFAQDMSEHHLQAVQMASWKREHTADPALRQLAFDIESMQTNQVGRMQGWLTLWGQPLQAQSGVRMAWMTDGSAHGGHGSGAGTLPAGGVRRMPGMAGDDELARLRSLSGRQLDVYFLQLMLRHHEGGTGMLSYAAERAGEPAVRNLARPCSPRRPTRAATSASCSRSATPPRYPWADTAAVTSALAWAGL